MIGIYKITNKINNKVYIGQSKDIEKRWKEHKFGCFNKNISDYDSKKNRAFRKYGIDNFCFEVIELLDELLLDEREKYWIQYYDSVNNGYNTSYGGYSPNLQGENHSQAKFSQYIIDKIIQDLIDNVFSYDEICRKYNITKPMLSNINRGKNWVKENINYPIRDEKPSAKGQNNFQSLFTDEEIIEIRKLYVNHSFKEIFALYKDRASESSVRKIIYGESYKHLPVYKKSIKKWIEACID